MSTGITSAGKPPSLIFLAKLVAALGGAIALPTGKNEVLLSVPSLARW